MSDILKRMIEQNDENDLIVKAFFWKYILPCLIGVVLLCILCYYSGYQEGKKEGAKKMYDVSIEIEKSHTDPEIDMLMKMGNHQLGYEWNKAEKKWVKIK